LPQPTVFIRDATGLTKELSLFDSIVYIMSLFSPGFAILLYTFYGPATFPGADLILAIAVIAPFVMIHAIAAGQMMTAMPRSGFDYVFVSRVAHPAVGFTNNFTYFAFQGVLAGAYLALLNSYVGNYFITAGAITGNGSFASIATMLSHPTTILAIGTILNLIIMFVVIGGLRISKFSILGLQVIGWISLVIALGIIAFSSQGTFATAWDHYFGTQVSYADIASVAASKGLVYGSGGNYLLGASVWAFFSITGYQQIGFLGGEVKRAKTRIVEAMVLGLAITLVVLAVGTYVIENTVGYSFLASAAYLTNNGVISVAPYYTLIDAVLVPNLGLMSFIYVGLAFFIITLLIGIYLSLTRVLFAWSFDSIIPTGFSKVSDRFHSPTRSTILIAILLQGGLILSLYSTAGSFLNLSLVICLVYVVDCTVAALFPILKPAMFNSSPGIASYRIGGKVPLISVTSTIAGVFFAVLAGETVINPSVAGLITPTSIETIAGTAILGLVIYLIARVYHNSHGIPLNLVFSEIPPE
jgi:amino acid transporter